MDPDLYFVLGIIIGAFAIPAILSAFSEGRPPRAAAILIMIGGGLVALAIYSNPLGYSIEGTPEVFVRVVGKYIN
jgi:hypothetical protein